MARAMALVHDLRGVRSPATPEELAEFETDVMAGFVLARAAAGMADSTISQDLIDLEQIREWFGAPLWSMEPRHADEYFGKVLRSAAPATRHGKASTLSIFFDYMELRHKVEIYNITGRAIECPIDEVNKPRGTPTVAIRVPPTEAEVDALFAAWRDDLRTCRKFAPMARSFAAAQLMARIGLRINECRRLDLDDIKWHLGRFGKLHVRYGKGSRGRGPKQRLVPLINGADRTLRWFVEDVWAHFGEGWDQPGAPLFPSERRNADGINGRISREPLRAALGEAVQRHLPQWQGRLTPHVLRHYCASQLFRSGMDLLAIQEVLGHEWVATTMRYVHVHREHIEDAWIQGQHRAARRLEGLLP
jgi:site-specific recombinase XerD